MIFVYVDKFGIFVFHCNKKERKKLMFRLLWFFCLVNSVNKLVFILSVYLVSILRTIGWDHFFVGHYPSEAVEELLACYKWDIIRIRLSEKGLKFSPCIIMFLGLICAEMVASVVSYLT